MALVRSAADAPVAVGELVAGDLQRALWGGVTVGAAELVGAGLQLERERARNTLDDVFALADDHALLVKQLEFGDLAAARVGDVEGDRAGGHADVRGRAAGVAEGDRDGLAATVGAAIRSRHWSWSRMRLDNRKAGKGELVRARGGFM